MKHVETVTSSRGQAHVLACEHCGAERYTCDIVSLTGLTCFRCGWYTNESPRARLLPIVLAVLLLVAIAVIVRPAVTGTSGQDDGWRVDSD